jgi:hypothetical protein
MLSLQNQLPILKGPYDSIFQHEVIQPCLPLTEEEKMLKI